MHHRKPNTNFAQYVMFWDRLMGTYRPYDAGATGAAAGSAKGEGAAAAEASAGSSKPEAGRLPAWADPAVERATGQVAERGVKVD